MKDFKLLDIKYKLYLKNLEFLIKQSNISMFLHLRPKCKLHAFKLHAFIGISNINCICRIFIQAVECIDAMFLHLHFKRIKFANFMFQIIEISNCIRKIYNFLDSLGFESR